ncbi:hypothetical protein C1N53_01680 [Pontibacter sp. SGAir0037]|nr:hypothetical protein C1N53_01680 [Pontibacter sp. SGAir0037]
MNTDQLDEVADSATNTRRDIVARPGTEEDLDPLPLPQPVLQLLEKHYSGWKQPALAEGVEKNSRSHEQGPYSVSGDFNGDGQQDYAVQIQQDEHVVMLAFLQSADSWQVQELKKDILFNDRGNLKTPYYLYLTEAGQEIRNQQNNQEITTPYDAVTVALNNNAEIYVLENGRFIRYNSSN